MKKEILLLREEMKKHGIDVYLVPTTDFHGSEYINDYFKCREFLSGFTGSAGTLVVTEDYAGLWTDGRYFLQAGTQLDGSGIELMKMNEPDVPTVEEFVHSVMKENMVLGFDGRVVDATTGKNYASEYIVKYKEDLTDIIWTDRPDINPSEIYRIPLEVTGETTESKLTRIRKEMAEAGADYHLVTSLSDVAWIYNLRGDDVENTPVFYGYTLITKDSAVLYVMDRKLTEADCASVAPYEQVEADLARLKPGKILIDQACVNYTILQAIPENVEIIDAPNPSEMMRAVKNETEIASTRHAHIKDGVAVVNFLYWVKKNAGKIPMTEISAADYLQSCRAAQDGFKDLSFETISGYGPNGAIIHYAPTPETDAEIKAEGFLLVDSGGQYTDGTTDITRTIVMGPVTEEMKAHYTAVLRCHLSLAMAEFTPDTLCVDLDKLTRGPLNDMGLNYNHGTGHGVGHMLSVHEGPHSISPRGGMSTMRPGMITSNEPGLYLEGKYGIRIETETLCYEKEPGVLALETITLAPYERDAILVSELTDHEKAWINTYHRHVRETLTPFLDAEVAAWLAEVTEEL